jgi:hypothetical protein
MASELESAEAGTELGAVQGPTPAEVRPTPEPAVVASERVRNAKRTMMALFAVAIIYPLFGTLPLIILNASRSVYVAVYSISAGFIVLALLARWSPLPAALAGLLLFLSSEFLRAGADLAILLEGWLVKLAILTILAAGIASGWSHRRMTQAIKNTSALGDKKTAPKYT